MSEGAKQPQNLFYHKLGNIMGEEDKSSATRDVLNLVDLILYKNREIDLAGLHQLLGPDLFVQALQLLGGKTITFPDTDEFKDIFTWALCYYAREIQQKDWKDLKEELGYDVSSIKWSMKNKQLTHFIQEVLHKKMSKQSVEEMLQELSTKRSRS
ncbi:MAG: hypothetical protein LC650_04050 [Actinobacteria bacterium]|nr:hypothetical protein [Actinomycetota bacterium]